MCLQRSPATGRGVLTFQMRGRLYCLSLYVLPVLVWPSSGSPAQHTAGPSYLHLQQPSLPQVRRTLIQKTAPLIGFISPGPPCSPPDRLPYRDMPAAHKLQVAHTADEDAHFSMLLVHITPGRSSRLSQFVIAAAARAGDFCSKLCDTLRAVLLTYLNYTQELPVSTLLWLPEASSWQSVLTHS